MMSFVHCCNIKSSYRIIQNDVVLINWYPLNTLNVFYVNYILIEYFIFYKWNGLISLLITISDNPYWTWLLICTICNISNLSNCSYKLYVGVNYSTKWLLNTHRKRRRHGGIINRVKWRCHLPPSVVYDTMLLVKSG